MQRHEDGYVIIACDFTGLDWDEHIPMIEGHKGSVISLNALALAIDQAREVDEAFQCTMCLRHFDPPTRAWRHADPPDSANPHAIICWDCIQQADRAFDRDPDTDWQRQIPADEQWR